jgi:hypothetical protein
MSFWKENKAEPTRQFRFTIDGSGIWWWAKSVDKPSFEINTSEYLLINHKFKYPGVLTWNDVNISLVDVGDSLVKRINDEYLKAAGYTNPQINKTGIQKNGYDGIGGNLIINQLDSKGAIVEKWQLMNSFIKSINYGSLDYSSDELVQIEMTIAYDYALLGEETTAQPEGSTTDS